MKATTTIAFAGLLMSLSGAAHATEAPLRKSFSSQMPPIESTFERWDICEQVDQLIDSLGFASSLVPRLCNQEMKQSFAVGVAAVTLAGTLNELVVEDGFVSVDGPVDIEVAFTPLVVAGGRAPRFAPCDRADFTGCSKPVLSTFANFLATFVPAIDLEVPVPVRVCTPGTPIVVEPARRTPGRWIAGYWSGWTWRLPRYIPGKLIPPVLELCRVTDFGQLPTITLPQVQEVVIDVFPHVTADMGLSVSGDGSIEIEIPIPYAGAKFGYGNSWMDLDLSAGLSLVLSMQVDHAGADAFLSFDQFVHVRSHFVKGEGWTQTAEVLENTMAPSLIPHSADVAIRAGVKLALEATAKARIGAENQDTEASEDAISESVSEDEQESADETGASELPPLPVAEPVQCAGQWLADGASLELGFETKAELVTFVEGSFATDGSQGFAISAGADFAHAEALSIPGLCSIECETLAGDDDPACGTIELFRLPIVES